MKVITSYDTVGDMDGTHEGERLRQVLKKHGKRQADLVVVSGTSRTNISKTLKEEEFKPARWKMLEQTLPLLGIDPEEIRPLQGSYRRERPPTQGRSNDELRKLLRPFSHDKLPAVRDILRATSEEHGRLLLLIDDRLDRSQ